MDLIFYVYEPSSKFTQYQHRAINLAEQEAERLARANPGKEFYVLAAISKVKKHDVVWDRVPAPDLPF